MENDVENLSRLIQDAGMIDGPMRSLGVPHASEFPGQARMIQDGQPIRIVGLPRSAEFPGVDEQPMMGTYRDNLLREMEERKNLALLEEMNMSLPPLGMIDPSKLVDSADIREYPIHSNHQQGGETPFMMMLIPMTDDVGKQENQQMADGLNQASVGQQMAGVPQLNQEMQENKQETQHGVLNTQAGNGANQEKQQQLIQQQQQQTMTMQQKQQEQHQSNMQQNQKQQPHRQTMQNDELIGAHSTHDESTVKPGPDVKKPAAPGKGKTIVHDELRQSEHENLIEQSEDDLESRV
uniref:Uncharacterized protein n=1 Tax=Cacopsylla melanoneura TaxID=428564 RepID=A0A8D9B059_9HEMI